MEELICHSGDSSRAALLNFMPMPIETTTARIGLVSISDRASQGIYEDEGLPSLKAWLGRAIGSPWQPIERLIADERALIAQTLIELCDNQGCCLVLTTGGTGPAPRDITPEATLDVADRELPGFGEQMRQISLAFVPTAILSRQTAVIRGRSLIVNLPGRPRAIEETLEGLRDKTTGELKVPGIFAAIPYGVELVGGPAIQTNEKVCKAFRPKK
jgi:molybdopterin adenylyltransferase